MATPLVQPPVIVLVRPQLGENIGMAARAMANFGLAELRLVAPRDGWPNAQARDAAVGAASLCDDARLFERVRDAISDCHFVLATTARDRGQAKRVVGIEVLATEAGAFASQGHKVAVLFGPERTGLLNDEVGLADAILTLTVDPSHPSINLAQSVAIVAHAWRMTSPSQSVTSLADRPEIATRGALLGMLDGLEAELTAAGYFSPAGKRDLMARNLRNIFLRAPLSDQDVRTLRGVVAALTRGRHSRTSGVPSAADHHYQGQAVEAGEREDPIELGATDAADVP